MTNKRQMTITEANEIWNACYGDPIKYDATMDAWQRYTWMQREEAIRVRNEELGGAIWGLYNISDRD
jgi:hypothetical protein